ncbi:3-hydroxyacyl-CoA dehydrogenase family protein [Planctomycetota bacterium]
MGKEVIKTAAVIGAGIMGHGMAQIMANNGVQVQVVDVSQDALDRARGEIEGNTDRMIEIGVLDQAGKEGILANLIFTAETSENLAQADLILEAVNENFDLKRKIWANLGEQGAPDAIMASNTSSYDINDLVEGVPNQERLLGIHWFMPPQITPCVEVIPGNETSQEVLDLVFAFLSGMGKAPVKCKCAPGFVANRIQMAMVKEATAVVEEGLATPQEVDEIVKTSMGFRLGAYGPFEIIDIAGADTYNSVFEYLTEKLGYAHFKPPALLADQVAKGKLGLKTMGGFYEYDDGSAERLRNDRDRKFYARLQLYKSEKDNG